MSLAEVVTGHPAENPIAGIGKAEALLARVRADATADLFVGVLGPGGCGKSALLSMICRAYESAGVRVVDAEAVLLGTVPQITVPSDSAIVIDDAHLLTADVLQGVRELVGRPGVRLVVSFRPWPRPVALTSLASALRRYGPLTVLQQLGRDEVARRANAMLGRPLPATLVDLLTDQTGGQPRILDEVLLTMRETGVDGATHGPSVPGEAIDRLRFVVDEWDPASRALLCAIAAGAKVEPSVLSALLDLEVTVVRDAVERARASGFLLGDGRLIPLIRTALVSVEPTERIRDIQVSLLDIHAGLGHEVVPVAQSLARSGIRNLPAAGVLVEAADAKLREEPASALALYADAIAAGAPADSLAVRRAEASVCTGQLDDALQLADPVLAAAESPDLARAIDVVATVMAHRGQLGRAAELYRWLGPDRIGAAGPMAALALVATGEPAEAKAFKESAARRQAPTMLAGAMSLIAEGVEFAISDSATSALSALSRATSLFESLGCTSMLLDSPAALTGIVAIQVGEFELAESVLRRAVDQNVGGTLARPRHLLLLAWIAMLKGNHVDAGELMAQALPANSTAEPREEIFAAALRVGLARRGGDPAVLAQTWHAAREAIVRQPIDLFVLLPLGEFVVAAALVGESELLDTSLAQAWSLLAKLGDPGMWSSPLQWCAVQACAVSRSVEGIEPLSRALDLVTPHNGYGRALSVATRSWLDVLNGDFDVNDVQHAAVGLQNLGLGFDAAALLSEAAARTPDRRAASNLLHLARGLQHTADPDPLPVQAIRTAAGPTGADRLPAPRHEDGRRGHSAPSTRLSGRELQVARLLLRNQTYREIGERLFISPKTVEHHVARMKQRIGASRRSELFSELRVLTEGLD